MRDLSADVPRGALVSTDNLTTLVAVVGTAARREWEASYESLAQFVVPRSSVLVAEDGEYAAMTVVLFRRVADDFRAAARAAGFQVKELAAAAVPPSAAEDGAPAAAATTAAADADAGAARLRAEAEAKRAALAAWCVASFGEAFSSWIHVTAVRLFVESVLRYGLPPRFLAALVRPAKRHTAALRKALAANFGAVGGQHFTSEGAGDDLFPYVSFTLNIEDL